MPVLRYWDGTQYQPIPSPPGQVYAAVAATAPPAANPTIAPPMGALWVDTTTPTPSAVPYTPPSTPPASGFNSFTDPAGTVWVSRGGSAWKLATQALMCRVYRAAAWTTSATANTAVAVTFDTAIKDDYGIWNGGTTFTAPIAGWWSVYLDIAVAVGVNQASYANLLRSGTRVAFAVSQTGTSTFGWTASVLNAPHWLAANDAMTVTIACTAASQNGGTGNDLCHMGMVYLGAG